MTWQCKEYSKLDWVLCWRLASLSHSELMLMMNHTWEHVKGPLWKQCIWIMLAVNVGIVYIFHGNVHMLPLLGLYLQSGRMSHLRYPCVIIKWKHFPHYWPFVWGIHQWLVNSPHKRPVTQSFDVLFDLRLNKWLSKQSRHWRFEMPSRSLWRHSNDEALKPWDQLLKLSNISWIWQVPLQHCCQGTCQIAEWLDNS